MSHSAIPPHILKQLGHIEPGSHFSGGLPKILSSLGKTYYAKAGSPREREQCVGEAESLKAIALAAPGLAPSLLAFGFVDENGEEVDGSAGSLFFISEYKDMTPLTERSGTTFCGATRLRNGWYETWERCFDALIGDLLSALGERGEYSDC